jgi:hypothetical protein
MISFLREIPFWVWFLFGCTCGFLLTNWLLSFHAEEKEKDVKRMQMLLAEARDELRKTNKALQIT